MKGLMSTRSRIGILENNEITSIYCHFDGYLSNNGKILLEKYNTKEKVKNLISGGNLSSLRDLSYYTQRGELFKDNAPNIASLENICSLLDGWIEYVYIFDCNSNEWNFLKNGNLEILTNEICG